jgi:rhodanese-related sulfurtransferase
MCRRDELADVGKPDTNEAESVDLACVRSVSALLPLLRDSKAIFVDLRSKTEHEKFHPSGSFFATAPELASKPYWYKKTVVLMGGGSDDVALLSLCGRLKQRGYESVYVMQGGVLSWIGRQLPINGHPPDVLALSGMSASELWASGQSDFYLKLVDANDKAFLPVLKGAVELARITPDGLRKALEDQQARRSKDAQPWLGVVLVSSSPMTAAAWMELQQAVAPAPLTVFRQGHKAFVKDSATQVAIWQSREQGPKRPACNR